VNNPHQGLTDAQARYYDDLARLRGQRGKLLELLIDEEWHPNYQCAEVGGLSFNDSIFAFRKEGWVIESRPRRGGVWEFRLTGKGDLPEGHKPMSRPQVVVAGHYMHVITDKLGTSTAAQIRTALPEWMQTDARPLNDEAAEEIDQTHRQDTNGGAAKSTEITARIVRRT
jgi:hypothetical protein